MKVKINCDSKTEKFLYKLTMNNVEKYRDLVDGNQFDEAYEKFSADNDMLGIMISHFTTLIYEVLGESLFFNLHNIPDYFLTTTNIQNFTVPDGYQSIGKDAFSNCKDLVTIFIPKSVKQIKENAFNNCSNLKTIYYNGTEEEYFNIAIAKGNLEFTGAKVQLVK